MNENYLWDKTGEDPEIELLENALQNFRCRETAPPALPAKIILFTPKSPRRLFPSFAFTFAAAAVIFAAVFAVWLSVSKPIPAVENETAQANFPSAQTVVPDSKLPKMSKPNDLAFVRANLPDVKKSAASKFAVARKITGKPKILEANASKNETFAGSYQPHENRAKLTRKEKYAYGQLMLALSITSSKLKIVKDKAEGLNKENNAFSDGK